MNQIDYSGRDNLEVMREARNYNRFLLELILSSASHDAPIVDFGAGNGTFALPIAAVGRRIICVETDPVLSAELAAHGLEVVDSLDMLEDGSIDYLYSLNVLEHIEDDDAVARSWFQKLRPGGRLFIYVPAFDVLYSSMDRKVGHFRRYTRQALNKKLAQSGFDIAESRYADSIGFFATLIYKLFDNGQGDVNLRLLKIYDQWVFPCSRMVDWIASPFFGKNVYVRAIKRA